MTEQTALTDSYYRCKREAGFLDTFYELFLAKSPEVAQKFARTDFKVQKLMLRQSLLEMICFDRGMPGTREEIERLGRHHGQLGVTPEMYQQWLDALCEAVKRHDPEYTPDLEQIWREAMRTSIDAMIAIGASHDA